MKKIIQIIDNEKEFERIKYKYKEKLITKLIGQLFTNNYFKEYYSTNNGGILTFLYSYKKDEIILKKDNIIYTIINTKGGK